MSSNTNHDSHGFLEELPRDLLRHTFDFLSGHELLQVSTVSRGLHQALEADETAWRKRLLAPSDTDTLGSSWKHRYKASTSLQASGVDRGGAIPLPEEYTSQWQSNAFSVDLWFCYSDSTDPGVNVGGVLLGAQSKPWSADTEETQPEYHQQLIHVDPTGNLYCSVSNKKEIVAKLAADRWYHVVLVHSQKIQIIYLDGALLRVTMEPLHVEWGKMKALQFGNGFMSYGSMGRPNQHFVGWYGFTGLLDEQRVWNRALSMGDVQCLARGERLCDEGAGSIWSSADSSKGTVGNVTRVHCNRPLERHVRNVAAVNK